MKKSKAGKLFKQACQFIPSGVNSPVRAFKGVGGTPVFIRKGKGPFIWDESGKKYLDFCASWGALLFGHAPSGLIQTLRREISNGTSFGTATRKETDLAREIHSFFPSTEKIRLVSSGTEAVMSAVRLVRGFTGRKKILKVDGGYHGHADSLLIKAGSGGATFGIPDSAGVPEELARLTLSIPFNDLGALESIFKKEGKNLAAFILEPIPANMGVVLPRQGYLRAVRDITKKYGVLLIFDELITGFRISRGGAQRSFDIQPDLTCLGKILGGGLPVAAFGGRKEIMDRLAPAGPVYQAGTLSGNPVAVTAALWVLKAIKTQDFDLLNKRAVEFTAGLREWIREKDLPLCVNAIGSMFTLFFTRGPVTDYASAKKSGTKRYARFFHAALKAGVYLAPSQFEANFISTAHTPAQLKNTLKTFQEIPGNF